MDHILHKNDGSQNKSPERRLSLTAACTAVLIFSILFVLLLSSCAGRGQTTLYIDPQMTDDAVSPEKGSTPGKYGTPLQTPEITDSPESVTKTPAKSPDSSDTPSNATPHNTKKPTDKPSQMAASPTLASASRQTQTPAAPATPSPTPNAPVQDSFFDGAVFVGDSVTLKLQYYMSRQRRNGSDVLGTAEFLAAGNMGSGNALQSVSKDSVHPTYQGVKMSLPDGIAKIGADKVYIMLGMNDIAIYGLDGSLKNMDTLINKIRGQAPAISVYIESVTPILKGRERGTLNNENIRKYNAILSDYCTEKGYKYVDIASVLTDSEGYLIAEYCSDPEGMGIHLTDEACLVWIDFLYTHV